MSERTRVNTAESYIREARQNREAAALWLPEGQNRDSRSECLSVADVDRARRLIDEAFDGKIRRASGQAYTVHLYETEALLCSVGFEDDLVLRIAALCHDGPEDVPDKLGLDVVREEFGADVAELVASVTKRQGRDIPWRDGWAEFIEKIRSATDDRTIVLELADRNSNLRDALRNTYRTDGDNGKYSGEGFWGIYKTSTVSDQFWMYEEMLGVFDERAAGRTNLLLDDYRANVQALREYLDEGPYQN